MKFLLAFLLISANTFAANPYWELNGPKCQNAEHNPYELQEKYPDKCKVSLEPSKPLDIVIIALRCNINGEARTESYFASKKECEKMVNTLKKMQKR